MEKLYEQALGLLCDLIRIPSMSRDEAATADLLEAFLGRQGVTGVHRKGNNLWACNRHFDPAKSTVLLNSHHDTVAPNSGYTRDPYAPDVEEGKLYGLGSNDAGGALVSLIATFLHFYNRADLSHNICLALSAEEEVNGKNGLVSIIADLGPLDFAVVGEPTGMQLAIAERGLMVLDCTARGRAGHAAREEGENAIYKAMEDIEWFRTYRFPRHSELFGAVKMSVTMIRAGSQHNVVPAACDFTVDVRVTDKYTNEEVLETIRTHVKSDVTPRSTHLRPSSIDPAHPIVQAGLKLGLTTYGSPTTSDQVSIPVPSVKIGPGDSARSHSADEFIYTEQVRDGVRTYIDLLSEVLK